MLSKPHTTAVAAAMALTFAGCSMNDRSEPSSDSTDTATDGAAQAAASDPASPVNGDADAHRWLEEVQGSEALRWVEKRNDAARAAFAGEPAFTELKDRLRTVFDSDDRIPYIGKIGAHYYNFWRDADHPRGLWRRTSLEAYRSDEPAWETVLDVDALAASEDENWVLGGFSCREPDYKRCLVSFSRGGGDAEVTREFDLESKQFVPASEGGFELPEAKSSVAWAGPDSVFVATDFGPGTLTDSGYARQVKLWQRGTPLSTAEMVYEGEQEDVSVSAGADLAEGFEVQVVRRGIDFWRTDLFVRRDGELLRIAKPESATAAVHRGRVFIRLREDWSAGGRDYPAGTLLAASLESSLGEVDNATRSFDVLFEPTDEQSLSGYTLTRNNVLLDVLDNVRNRIFIVTPAADGNGWEREVLFGDDGFRSIGTGAIDSQESDEFFVYVNDYLTPPTLQLGRPNGERELLKQSPSNFDTAGLSIEQHWARSADGTRVPYFQVSRGEPRADAPTLLYGYGGFEISMTPGYSSAIGIGWLERGGNYVVANIRGGGEFGPRWHRTALRENRQRSYDDFIAVAEDLIRRGVTEPKRLGIRGGSNGGLLMGNMLTMRPDLFGAIVAQVPLFDMRRYHELLAGASWIAEFGNPDVAEDWSYLRNFSPYHNVSADATYPAFLVTTSTQDDRVHPGHARKMVARMEEMGHTVDYYENVEGGHAGAANNEQSAFMQTLVYEYLWRKIGPAS